MSLGELDHRVKFRAERLACREFDNVNGKTAFVVDADLGPFNGVVRPTGVGSVVGIGHFVAPRSDLGSRHKYLI